MPSEHEARQRRCAFGAQFAPPIQNCLGTECMSFDDSRSETEEHPVGIIPAGAGWVKDGPDTGIGGAVTYKQKWRRPMGVCARR
jgi:hypothetical protein